MIQKRKGPTGTEPYEVIFSVGDIDMLSTLAEKSMRRMGMVLALLFVLLLATSYIFHI